MELPEYPPKVDIKTQIYEPLPKTAKALSSWETLDASEIGINLLAGLSTALQHGNRLDVETFFAIPSAHWRDTLALTAHLRTFSGRERISSALLELCIQRGAGGFEFHGGQVVAANEDLKWLDCGFSFSTGSPRALCKGKLMLVPSVRASGDCDWKIWSMTTWLAEWEEYPENEALLRLASAPITGDGDDTISTDVLVIGGGNAGILLAARLKALDVDYVVVDRNDKVGDNWLQRYDCMRFHVYKSFCETPYIPDAPQAYPHSSNDGLTRDQLGAQIQAFAREFDLERRVLHRTTVTATAYDSTTRTWSVELRTGERRRRLSCRCLVLATGAGFSGAAPLPDLPGRELFRGPSMHSVEFRNAKEIVAKGAKSAVIIGSANTAFDVMVDCHDAGLQTTMVQRSETYVVPMTYFAHPLGLGVYNVLPTEDADALINGGPLAIGGSLLGLVHATQAQEEPDRYDEVRKAGLRVRDSLKGGDLLVNLLDRCGGHFVDMGKGIDLIATKEVGIRSGVVPKAYTPEGLLLSDGSKLETDAVIWCTGFGHVDGRKSLPDVLGDGAEAIAGRLEPTWGIDAEGETRGLWKRHPGVDNLWIFSGGTAQHRWFSKVIAQQVKGVLEGILPDAYRRTPEPDAARDWGHGGTWANL
ncbi:Flavin-containing monooxygenase [Colletotrichum higginsianum IMI 349063]|uniref:Flavin-containing monooxygenase n=1 Tax=Colletotrichum higginsianum (strain IMI 349063) TaxID=759273 RepID=A0A1B7Y2W6_COLHI|nr:Flavin-containing monooxygenase [Colletotrichum higginsianum IMI 349063]OBR06352.1 Flavin-containing monooxygenase [Colletotrichum higginsianum IMI 349063]